MSASDMSISCESGDHLGLKVSWQEADNSSAYLNHVFGPEIVGLDVVMAGGFTAWQLRSPSFHDIITEEQCA